MKIGAQFYTIRDFCKNLDDFSESIKKVADIGYTTVQISGVCAYEPEWLAEQLKAAGLTCGITHYNYDRILRETDRVIAEHKIFGCKYIGIGGYFGGLSGLPEFVELAKPAARKMHTQGCLFMYHNHSHEYEMKTSNGKTVMEYLSDTFTAEEMGFTLDTYWVKYGGYDPLSEIQRLKGRLPAVHLKDMRILDDGTKQMQWIGNGNVMNFEKIAEAFEDAGAEYAYVEQDNCNGENPFDCLKKSYEYLRSIGLN